MIKKLVLSGALLLVLVLPDNSAQAGFFDWVSQNNENSYLVSSSWSLDKVLKGLQLTKAEIKQDEQVEAEIVANKSETKPAIKKQPIKTAGEDKKTMVVVATAYSSTPDQTDDSPFTTAWNTQVRDGIIAANFLPFGTQVRIPEIFGDKIFVVEDRMNKRYEYRIDVWFPERNMAKEFGVKKVKLEVI